MNTTENRQIVEQIFLELATGNSRPLIERLADDVRWTVMGHTPWSKVYDGKQHVMKELLGALGARLAGRYRAAAHRILADGAYVVVQARGESTTKAGVPYNNEYCFIYRFEGDSIAEVTEYLDTQLLMTVMATGD